MQYNRHKTGDAAQEADRVSSANGQTLSSFQALPANGFLAGEDTFSQPRRFVRASPKLAGQAARMFDALGWLVAFCTIHGFRYGASWIAVVGMVLLVAVCVIVEDIRGFPATSWLRGLARHSASLLGAFVLGALTGLWFHSGGANLNAGWQGGLQAALIVGAFRLVLVCVWLTAEKNGRISENVALFGQPSPLRLRAADEIQSMRGVRLVGLHDLQSQDQAQSLVRARAVDRIILVTEGDMDPLRPMVRLLEVHPVDVGLLQPLPNGPVGEMYAIKPLWERVGWLQSHRQQGWGYVAKRLMDIVIASAALVLLSPLLITIAFAIVVESPGPALFKQIRFGYGGRPFLMWKFRSMRHETADASGSRLTSRNDDRVTRVGNFLRRTSLDELPQLVNILRGELSVVGPRPHPAAAKADTVLYDDLIPNFKARYRVRPGLTGLAQCMGLRGNTDTEGKLFDRFEQDMRYVESWSFWLDVKIVLKTVVHIYKGENAF